jgi:predicted Fe-S protein YdhL (DUF1289 family)
MESSWACVGCCEVNYSLGGGLGCEVRYCELGDREWNSMRDGKRQKFARHASAGVMHTEYREGANST